MDRRLSVLVTLSAVTLLATSSLTIAAQEAKPPMQKDSEVAAEYKNEAAQLRAKAAHHRKLAALYRSRTLPKGGSGSYAGVAEHCEKLAKFYEDAANEADGVSSELNKQ